MANRFVRGLVRAAVAGLALTVGNVQAQAAWPERPIKLVVPFPAGGNTDAIARLLAEQMSRRLGQPIVVENRAGAGGTVGADQAAKAPADGHTLLLGTSADQVNGPFLYAKLPYAPLTDLEPLALLARDPILLVVGRASPIANMGELVAYARRNPGALNFASSGSGTTGHLAGVLLQEAANLKLNHVAYKGSAPAIADVLGGHVQLLFASPLSIDAHVKSGAVRTLAVASDARLTTLPSVPTMLESGIGVEISTLYFLMAPSGLPAAIADRLTLEAQRAIADPGVSSRIRSLGAEPVGSAAAAALRTLQTERAKWKPLIERSRIIGQ